MMYVKVGQSTEGGQFRGELEPKYAVAKIVICRGVN